MPIIIYNSTANASLPRFYYLSKFQKFYGGFPLMRKNISVLFVALVVSLSVFSISAMAKGGVVVTISVDKPSFAETERVAVNVTISNPAKGAIRVLKWYT